MNLRSGVLLAVLLLFSLSAKAAGEPVWETFVLPNNLGVLSISDQPCTVPVAIEKFEEIRANVKARFNTDIGEVRLSRLLWMGTVYAGCYAIGPDNGNVYNIDSAGDPLQPSIPRILFRPHEEVVPEAQGTDV